MPITELDILKAILLKEEATETLPQGFEEDPMGFILKKYPGLNEVLNYLMTESFKEYVDAIFVVAPKPTTFKIVLHNGQYVFLQFMGKAYQATVLGKNYYLMSIGEKERCMVAIARLLRYGNPLKTKGPEGAEQGTRPEEETGLEGGATGEEVGGAEGGETAAPETGGGEEGGEELKELRILQEILKKSLNEKTESDKPSEDSIVWSKTLTIKDLLKKPKVEKFNTVGRLIYNYITKGKSILVAKDPKDLEKRQTAILQFKDAYADNFLNSDYKNISSSEKIFKDENNEEYSIENIVKIGVFGGDVKDRKHEGEQKAINELQSEIDDLRKKEGNKSGIDIRIGSNVYKNIVYADFQEEEYPEPKSDIVLKDSDNKIQVYISHKKEGGFRSWSSVQGSKDPEVIAFVKKIETIAQQELGNNWEDLFPKTKKSYYTEISDNLIKKLIYGKDVGGQFGKNNVQMIIIGGKLNLKESGKGQDGKNIYEITGYTKSWINSEVPTDSYTPILKAEYNSTENAYNFIKCKIHAVTENLKSKAIDLTSGVVPSTTSTTPTGKSQKIEKISIPKDSVRVIESRGETRVFVKREWVFKGGLAKEIAKYTSDSAEKEKTLKRYQSYFDIDPKSVDKPIVIPKVGEFIYLKPDNQKKFEIPDKEIKATVSDQNK